MLTQSSVLDNATAGHVRRLAGQAAAIDGTAPLNESARLALTDPRPSRVSHWLTGEPDEPAGYAQLDRRDGSVQLFVAPAARGRGLGGRLAEAVQRSGTARIWWAFGDLPGARVLAGRLGLQPVRGLLKMSLPMTGRDPAPIRQLPGGLRLDHFRDGDLAGLVRVNHAAFSHHPEQGGLTTADFTARMASDWYRDRDLLVARDAAGGLAGFHWTKLTSESGQPVGEVYVLAVAPGSAGRGVGGALLDAGIMHMQARGVLRIDLYVEAANDRVVELYRRSGFTTTHTDLVYGPSDGEQDG